MNRKIKKAISKIILPLGIIFGLTAICFSLGVFNPRADLLESHYKTKIALLYSKDDFLHSTEKSLVKYAENEKMVLWVNPSTASIAVEDKQNKTTWYSSPLDDPEKKDLITTIDSASKEYMNSTISLNYYHPSGTKQVLYSYNDSVKKEQYIIKKVTDGVDMTFVFGNLESATMLVPSVIPGLEFEEKVIGNKLINTEDLFNIKRYYIKNDAGDYVFGTNFGKVAQESAVEIFARINIDPTKDFTGAGEDTQESAQTPLFAITVELRIADGGFQVNIPTGKILFNKTYPIASISLLDYFGAGYSGGEGYLLVPDGCGSLVDFNNKNGVESEFSFPIYGEDLTKGLRFKETETQVSTLPIFGIHKAEQGFLAIIKEGATLATVKGSKPVSDSRPFAYVHPEFLLIDQSSVILGEGEYEAKAFTYQKSMYEGSLSIDYKFLEKNKSDYSAMANSYREYLIAQNPDLKNTKAALTKNAAIPFYVELIGAAKGYQSFLGLNYEGIEPLTTFDQAEELITNMQKDGVSVIKPKFTAYFNGGIDQTLPVRFNVEKSLGGVNGLKNLLKFTNQQSIPLYTSVTLQTAYPGNGYQINRNASRTMDERNAKIYSIYNLVSQKGERPQYIVSPEYLATVVDKWLSKTGSLQSQSVAMNDLGSNLYQDYKKASPVNREQSMKIIIEQAKKIKSQKQQVMYDFANSYAIPYATDMINVATTNSGFLNEDETIPFYQMVISGLVSYTGNPWNLTTDTEQAMLKSVEYGGGVYYRWIYAASQKTKDTDHPELFSLNYKTWYDEAINQYKKMNGILGPVQGMQIVSHNGQLETPGVTLTQYEDGSKVYVNYNQTPVTIDGLTIAAKSFDRRLK